MNESYTEILVKRETPASLKVAKVAMIVFTVLLALAGILMFPIFLLGALVMGLLVYFVTPRFNVEYEYLYVGGDLDIDAIYSQKKRKRIASYSITELEMIAPDNSHALDSFRNRPGITVRDFSSGDPQAKIYGLVANKEKGQEYAKLELTEEVLHDIRRQAPRKVSQY